MRNFFISFLLVTSVIACKQSPVKGPNGVVYKNPTEYNDYIITRQVKLMKNIVDFTKMLQQNPDSAIALMKRSSASAAEMITEIKGMPAYKSDSSFRSAAIESFTFYKRLFDRDYPAILDAYRKEGVSEEEADAEANRIAELISRDEEMLNKTFQKAQQQFAEKNKLKLISNPEQKKLEDEFDKIESTN